MRACLWKPLNRADWGGRRVEWNTQCITSHIDRSSIFSRLWRTIFTTERKVSVMCQIMNTAQNGTGEKRRTFLRQSQLHEKAATRDSNRFAKFNFSIKISDSITSFDLNESELNNSIEIIIVSGKAKRSSSLRSHSVAIDNPLRVKSEVEAIKSKMCATFVEDMVEWGWRSWIQYCDWSKWIFFSCGNSSGARFLQGIERSC